MSSTSQNICKLNNEFRKTLVGGKLMMSTGIQALGDLNVALILSSIQRFDLITSDNDPHNEHNVGSFKHNGVKVYFKRLLATTHGLALAYK